MPRALQSTRAQEADTSVNKEVNEPRDPKASTNTKTDAPCLELFVQATHACGLKFKHIKQCSMARLTTANPSSYKNNFRHASLCMLQCCWHHSGQGNARLEHAPRSSSCPPMKPSLDSNGDADRVLAQYLFHKSLMICESRDVLNMERSSV
jgi:hypothetical protein